MSKITKSQRISTLERKVAGLTTMISSIQTWLDYADGMLTELNHALPDPEYDAQCEANEADIDASLNRHHERLGLNKPKLKQLDQSVFIGLDEKWRFAAVDGDGEACLYGKKPHIKHNSGYFYDVDLKALGTGYDTSDWQNSLIEREAVELDKSVFPLIERESVELTGSDLCRKMLDRGDKYVMCKTNDNDFIVISGTYEADDDNDAAFVSTSGEYTNVIPINNQGEPLTASEVGL